MGEVSTIGLDMAQSGHTQSSPAMSAFGGKADKVQAGRYVCL